MLLRGLGRLDVFPLGDVGAARGLSALMHLGPGASLDRIVERFGDHPGYLYFCVLGARLLARSSGRRPVGRRSPDPDVG